MNVMTQHRMLDALNTRFVTHSSAEFHPCSLIDMSHSGDWSVAGLFAGIGGIELGLQRAGMHAELLCEWWQPAQNVLREQFVGVPVAADVRGLQRIPTVKLVSAGFPCTDLSQAGRTRGIGGEASGLVDQVFRLLRPKPSPWLLLENVKNMLTLDRGRAMQVLVDEVESMGYRWAYRLVDSRFTGVPQRRQRVIFLASLDADPAEVLFADDEGEPDDGLFEDTAFGFYWTEGRRGLGWARDCVPTLKGGSTVGIPSPPAIWNPNGVEGRRIVTPTIGDAEQMQGFDVDWTLPAAAISNRVGTRWKLVGNAVTVGVSEWVGTRLQHPGAVAANRRPLSEGDGWPPAASGANGQRWLAEVSTWPIQGEYTHLRQAVDLEHSPSLSARATAGFHDRLTSSSLRTDPRFVRDLASHLTSMAA